LALFFGKGQSNRVKCLTNRLLKKFHWNLNMMG